MKRIIGFLFVIIGGVLIAFGSYKKLENKDIDKKENNEETEGNSDKATYEEKYNNVIDYLTSKYNERFEIEALEKTYCLEVSDFNSFYSMPCSSDKIKHEIYKVKSQKSGITFYVKEVSYDEDKVNILASEKDFETKGYYDNYMSYFMKEKLEEKLLPSYKKKFGNNVSISIYEGMGIYDISSTNAYQYLDGKLQQITDKETDLDDFIDGVTEQNFSILVKTNKKITSDNFMKEVSLFENIKSLKYNGLALKKIIVTYENDNRYLVYDTSFDSLALFSGKDTMSSFNDKVYDKTILFGNAFSSDGIYYKEFKKLSSSAFNF